MITPRQARLMLECVEQTAQAGEPLTAVDYRALTSVVDLCDVVADATNDPFVALLVSNVKTRVAVVSGLSLTL